MISLAKRCAIGLALALPAVLGGCAKKLTVLQYPEYYDPAVKTLAVLPFTNQTSAPKAGQVMAERLAEALRANGTYQVLTGLGTLSTSGPSAPQAQAMLTGTVHEYSSGSQVLGYVADYPNYYYSPYYDGYYYYRRGRYYGGWGGGYWGYGPVRMYLDARNEGHVSVSVRLTSSDGKALFAMDRPARVSIVSGGTPPELSPQDCLFRASEMAVNKLVEQLAIMPRTVKIDPGKAMRIGSARIGGGWKYEDRFSADDQKMFVVLSLPPLADRNTFVLEVRRKDGSGVLAGQEFVWSAQRGVMGVELNPSRIYAAGGEGSYEVAFVSQGKEVMRKTFHIRGKK